MYSKIINQTTFSYRYVDENGYKLMEYGSDGWGAYIHFGGDYDWQTNTWSWLDDAEWDAEALVSEDLNFRWYPEGRPHEPEQITVEHPRALAYVNWNGDREYDFTLFDHLKELRSVCRND